jgi:hypothetical protein
MAVQAQAQSKRSMPTLDLPEYVISGAEKATHIGGEKLSFLSDDPDTFIPELQLRIRPAIPTGQIVVQPEPPSNIAGVRFGYHNYSLSAGSFESLNANYNTVIRLSGISLTADGWHRQAPKNIKAGLKFEQGVKSSVLVRSDDKGVFDLTGQFESSSFRRTNGFDQIVSLSEYSLTTTGNSVRSRFGELNYSARLNRWSLLGDLDSDVLSHDIRLAVSRRLKDGRLSLNVRQFGEPSTMYENDFNFTNADISYNWQQSRDWKIAIATKMFMTSSYTLDGKGIGTRRENNGIKMGLSTEKKLSERDLIYFRYMPVERPNSVRALYDYYPMMSDSVGGIVESGSRLVGGYSREINPQIRLNVSGFYQNSLDHPVPVSLTAGDWFLETARFTGMGVKVDASARFNSSADLNLFGSWQDAQVSKGAIEMAAPEEAELSAGFSGEYLFGGWSVASDLIWYSKKPINLRGAETIPAHAEFNARATYRLKPDILLSLSAENLLNQHYYAVPGYDANPPTVMIGVSHVSAK